METKVRLHPAVQALQIDMRVQGRAVQVVVDASFLEVHFGSGSSPESWLNTYQANVDAVHRAIERKAALTPEAHIVVLLVEDFHVEREAGSAPA